MGNKTGDILVLLATVAARDCRSRGGAKYDDMNITFLLCSRILLRYASSNCVVMLTFPNIRCFSMLVTCPVVLSCFFILSEMCLRSHTPFDVHGDFVSKKQKTRKTK